VQLLDQPQPTLLHNKLQRPLIKPCEETQEVVLEVLEVLGLLVAQQDNRSINKMWYHKLQTYISWEAYPLSSQAIELKPKTSSTEYKPTYASIGKSQASLHQ